MNQKPDDVGAVQLAIPGVIVLSESLRHASYKSQARGSESVPYTGHPFPYFLDEGSNTRGVEWLPRERKLRDLKEW